MAVGLFGGIAVSAVTWGLFLERMTPTLVALVIAVKLGLGALCLALADWRPLGQGMLASIAVGAMIFLVKFCSGIGG
jgi:hypothetical protein